MNFGRKNKIGIKSYSKFRKDNKDTDKQLIRNSNGTPFTFGKSLKREDFIKLQKLKQKLTKENNKYES